MFLSSYLIFQAVVRKDSFDERSPIIGNDETPVIVGGDSVPDFFLYNSQEGHWTGSMDEH
jgi:hypothetical protein